MNKCIIVVPVHTNDISKKEIASLVQLSNVIKQHYYICLVHPKELNIEIYKDIFKTNIFKSAAFDKKWFTDSVAYNNLCIYKRFYEIFQQYEYMLIYQTDCWLFYDNIDYYINLDYDWYGAPWCYKLWKEANDGYLEFYNEREYACYLVVGNGGFNLRKIKVCLDIVNNIEPTPDTRNYYNEDTWFCMDNRHKMNICPAVIACQFSRETYNPYTEQFNTHLYSPMGVHAWNLPQFSRSNPDIVINWEDALKERGIEI